MTKLFISSPNVVRDKEFRRRLNDGAGGDGGEGGGVGAGPTAADEAFEVVRQAVEEATADAEDANERNSRKTYRDESGNDVVVISSKSDLEHSNNPNNKSSSLSTRYGGVERKALEVKAKLFLKEFSFEAAKEALERIFRDLDSNYVDSLQVSVPYSGLTHLAISEQEKERTQEYEQCLGQLIQLWTKLESFVADGSVLKMGLCDVETKTLRALCDDDGGTRIKPSTITLNLASCCVVPPEMQEFASSRGIKLVTHNDPPVILSEKRIRAIAGNKFNKMDWVVRYQVMDASRGVLLDKRYVVGLNDG